MYQYTQKTKSSVILCRPTISISNVLFYHFSFPPPRPTFYLILTMTYGISTSSSALSSAVISKMTFFW